MLLYHFPLNTQENIVGFVNKGMKSNFALLNNNIVQVADNGIVSNKCVNPNGDKLSIDLSLFDEFSFCFRFYADSNLIVGTSFRTIVGLNTNTTQNNPTCSLFTTANSANYSFSGSSYNGTFDNKWHSIVITKKSTTIKVYVNSTLITTGTFSDSARYICLWGRYSTNSYNIDTLTQDIRIYDYALSQAEINEYSRALVVHYPLNGNVLNSNVIKDCSGFGNDLSYLIPNEYQLVEYLDNNGTATINTDVIYKGAPTVKIGFEILTNNDLDLLGIRNTNNTYLFNFNPVKSANAIYYRYGNTTTNFYINLQGHKKGELGKKAIINGREYWSIPSSWSNTFQDNTYPILLFRARNITHAKIYYCKIYVDDILLRDFYPVRRKIDNVAGMYDVLNQKFYTNAETGYFIAGNDVITTYQQDTPRYMLSAHTTDTNIVEQMPTIPTYTKAFWVKYNGNWKYLAITSTNVKYVDGVESADYDTIVATITSNGYDVSDYRVYATALSAEDIKNLYNSPIVVSNQHQAMAFEFVEGNDGFSANKNGIVQHNELREAILYPSKYWRTPTYAEMSYILNTRTNASNLCTLGRVNVNGNYVNGCFLLPDNWVLPAGISMTITMSNYTTNTYNLSDFVLLENAGAVFLPFCYSRSGVTVGVGAGGILLGSFVSSSNSYRYRFLSSGVNGIISVQKMIGFGVRLCKFGSHFSISATAKIDFAKSNIKYHCKNKVWALHEHSYDIIGADNANISDTYNGWIDLFGYGTSGVHYSPTLHTTNNADYASGDIANTDNDWGVNEIQSYEYNQQLNGIFKDKILTNGLIEN